MSSLPAETLLCVCRGLATRLPHRHLKTAPERSGAAHGALLWDRQLAEPLLMMHRVRESLRPEAAGT